MSDFTIQMTSILSTIEGDEMVQSVKKWENGKVVRHYIALTEQGSANCKIWADVKAGRIVCDFGRKACSPAYSKALDRFEATIASYGTISRAYKGAPDFTLQIAEG